MPAVDPRSVLRDRFGYPGFRPGQEALVQAALAGRDALGVLPTGGGKSVCYQLPALLLPGLVVVVSPLISLMEDQVARARAVGLRAAFLNSTLERSRARQVLRDAGAGRLDLLFLAPERFHVDSFRAVLDGLRVSLLAVDEAHCISQWGHDFRPEYGTLGPVREEIGAPVLALTATATPRVRDEIARSLRLRRPARVVLGFDRPNLSWSVARARGHGDRIRALHRLLGDRGGGVAVIYAATRRAVEAVRRDLSRRGHRVEAYHAGLPAAERTRIQEAFLDGGASVVVATNAFGMGIDKPDVRLVAHYQVPGSLEGYYQEAGRAGRDGEPARCVVLFHPRDLSIHRRFARTAHPPPRLLGRVHRHLRRRVGAGRRGAVDLHGVVEALGGVAGERDAVAALRALERSGAVRLYRCPEPGGTRSGRTASGHGGRAAFDDAGSDVDGNGEAAEVDLGLHSGPLDARLESRLRRRSLARLRSVAAFARTRRCRRRVLLEYFGEEGVPGRCGACDRCAPHLFSPSGLR